MKFYCNHPNIMADQREYTLNAFSYMLTLGPMKKEDFLCVNTEKHDVAKYFETDQLMREQCSQSSV